MPRRTDLKRILIIGSGPIVIGQACEFDYSGTQGCRALREEGFEVRSEEHTSELQSLRENSYAVFCLKKKRFSFSGDSRRAFSLITYPCSM